jgi:hypothetical protein
VYSTLKQKFTDQIGQYIFYSVVHIAGSLAIWGYYSSLLLRAANYNVEIVFLNLGMHAIGGMAGFLMAGRLFSYFGYSQSFRVGVLLNSAVCVFTLVTLNNILEVHLILAVLRGISVAFFWVPRHIFSTRELGPSNRKELLGKLYSAEELLTVLLPPLAGALIGLEGYDWLFGLGAIVYFLAALFPKKPEIKKKERLEIREMRAILHLRGFRYWAAYTVGEEIFANLRLLTLTVIPFLLIKNEFDVGALTAAVGIIGSLLAFWHSRDSETKSVEYGYIGSAIVFVSTAVFIVMWDIPSLIFRSLASRIGFAIITPVEQDLKYQLRTSLIGDFKDEYNVEIQEYAEIFLFIARMLNVVVISWLVFNTTLSQELILKVLLAASLLREAPFLWLGWKLKHFFKR